VANRLAQSTSPYLLQHADNPVDWFPWGDAAFAAARERQVPILLSVGYAACHWCHVMAHESFEDVATAKQMNESFVNVKVDREERPDVDAIYMDAVTAMTGHGGWPMTAFLTPEGEPFFAGTYFPSRRGGGSPAFTDVLTAITDAWHTRRSEVAEQAKVVVARLDEMKSSVDMADSEPLTPDALVGAVSSLTRQYDSAGGGFGTAPKFPPSMVMEFLLRHHARTGNSDALLMAEGTMRAMASGGMYDQLAGGFARYSVDANWVVPHFEKMLYDNALLARVGIHLWHSTGRELGRRTAIETADFMMRELRTPEGAFASALDADTEGVEGRFYAWSPDQLTAALGPEDGAWAAELFGVTVEGTFEEGLSTLQLRVAPDDVERFHRVRTLLENVRTQRTRPARDDKVVASWNGLAIAALADIGASAQRPDLIAAAAETAAILRDVHMVSGVLRRVSRAGTVGEPHGVLEDYGNLGEGLIALYSVTGDVGWLTFARELAESILSQFGDSKGGLFDTAHNAERLVRRPQDPGDNASPSGQSAAAGLLLSVGALSGDQRFRDAARRLLANTAKLQVASPRFAGWWLAVAEAWTSGPQELAIVGPAGALRDALLVEAYTSTSPGLVLAVESSGPATEVALLQNRVGASLSTAYVCHHFVCDAPTSDPAVLASTLVGANYRGVSGHHAKGGWGHGS